jgi:hypothetical protein
LLVGIDDSTTPVSYPSLTPEIRNRSLTVAVADSDGDGLSDDTEQNMGTNPNLADSDGDGLNDGAEQSYWGGNWNQDPDGDGLINILDPDSDNDGYSDGDEVADGKDPADPASRPDPLVHVYEDAENGNTLGWSVNDAIPSGATIMNLYDGVRSSNVIELTGDGTKNSFLLVKDNGGNWRDQYKVLQWSMQYAEQFTVVIKVKTKDGLRNLIYSPVNNDNLGTGSTIHHGLGSSLKNGSWHTVTRDLQYDLQEAQPTNELLEILQFQIKGTGRLDDIQTLSRIPDTLDSDGDTLTDSDEIYTHATHPYHADSDGDGFSDGDELLIGTDPNSAASRPVNVYEDAENGNVKGWSMCDNDPAGATRTNINDTVRGSKVIELQGAGMDNCFRLLKDNGANWRDSDYMGMQWSMNYSETFRVAIVVKTTDGIRNLLYTPINSDKLGTTTGKNIHHGLGAALRKGNWRTVTRDLQQDLQDAQPTNDLLEVVRFEIRGSGRLDDIQTLYLPVQ